MRFLSFLENDVGGGICFPSDWGRGLNEGKKGRRKEDASGCRAVRHKATKSSVDLRPLANWKRHRLASVRKAIKV